MPREFVHRLSHIEKCLTFDDVNIRPTYSEIIHRSDCDLTARLTKRWKLNTPIVSSPMDTVTEADMAWEMSSLGGLGFIHRFMTVEEQVDQIKLLKQYGWTK